MMTISSSDKVKANVSSNLGLEISFWQSEQNSRVKHSFYMARAREKLREIPNFLV